MLFGADGTEHHFAEFSEDLTTCVIDRGPQGGKVHVQQGAAASYLNLPQLLQSMNRESLPWSLGLVVSGLGTAFCD